MPESADQDCLCFIHSILRASCHILDLNAPRIRHKPIEVLAFPSPTSKVHALMEKTNKAVLTDLQAISVDSLKERLAALRRFL